MTEKKVSEVFKGKNKLSKQIYDLYKAENFKELETVIEDEKLEEVVLALENFKLDILCEIFPKLPEEVAAKAFVKLSVELQRYLTDNISSIEFQPISEEILDNDGEDSLNEEVLNEVLLKAEVDTRHEKLVKILEEIEGKNFAKLKPLLSEMEPVDIAEVLNDLDENKAIVLFRLLPKDLASETFVEMDSKMQEILVKAFTDKELSSILNELFVDDTLDIIEEMPSSLVVRILRLAGSETRDMINKLLGFPKDSAGSIMTPEYISLREKMTCEEAMKKIRKQALDKETIYSLYVTDDQKKLLGIVSARDLIIHEPKEKIGDFMQENIISAHTHTDKEEVSQLLSKYDLLAIPIVDSENRINGIVTIDDAVDVIQEEASEDISKMAAITPTTKPYLQTNVFRIFANRVPWLLLLLLSATFTGLIINVYEATLNSLSPLLFACIPMLMGTGGNAGSQASVTLIQSLATNEVTFKDTFKVIWKEIRISVIVAFVLAITCFAKLLLIDNLIFGYDYTIKISIVVSLALFVTICIAKIIGSILPIIAKKCRLDPAVVASPFITTIIDIISLVVFCGFSVMLLG